MAVEPMLAPPLDILIADDDESLRASVRLLLEGHGYVCAEAADGRAAVEIARTHPPQCVLLDLAMPGLDGFAVARRLRADPRTRHSHIHCLTGHDDEGARRAAAQAGCELFLAKPVDPAALLGAVGGGVKPVEVKSVSGLTRAQAADLLDWLENNGCPNADLSHAEETGFTVRYRVYR